MMDKRVVEFGLTIPETLYVKNGRDRYLACRALADVYPAEFQTRPPNQDPRDPDYVTMLRAALPILQADVERLARNEQLQKYIDFDKLQNAAADLRAGAKLGPATVHAMRAFHAAKYIAWFCGTNR